MAGNPFGTTPFGTWPVTLASLRTSDDSDFLRELNSTVAFEYDVNSAGTTVDEHLSRPPKYEPVPGFDAVPCRLVLDDSLPYEHEARPGQVTSGRILFGVAVPADRRNRVVFLDPDRPRGEDQEPLVRYFYLKGDVINAHQLNIYWFVDVQNRPL